MNSLGEELKYQRELTNKTMKQLADLTGLSQSFISQIENNKRKPSYEAMYKIISSLSRDIPNDLVVMDPEINWDQEDIEDQYRMLLYAKFSDYLTSEDRRMLYNTLIASNIKDSLEESSYVTDLMHRSSDLSQILDFTFNESHTFYLDSKSLSKSEFNKIKTLLKGIRLEREENTNI